jgi:hypothetical protein
MNVVDKKGLDSKSTDSLKVKSYKTSAITRLSKHKGASIGVHMQRKGGEEVVKEYTFASAQDRDMFERTVNVMNRYGTVVNHVFDESVTKAVSNARFSYAALTKSIDDTMGHEIPKNTWIKLCGPEDGSIASVTLRQLFRVIGNADEATMMPTTPHGSTTSTQISADDGSRNDVHKAAIELARKRVESTVDLRDRERSEMLTLLHDRCSLQWQRISDGKTERTYISGRLVATPFRIIFIATSKTVRQKRMSLYMSSSFTVSVRSSLFHYTTRGIDPTRTPQHTGTLAHNRQCTKRSR